jgi:putative transposase
MTTLAKQKEPGKNGFEIITNTFLNEAGLPFASVLDAESIQRVFREEGAFFGQDDMYSTEIVVWAFLAQALRDGKGASCSSAVEDISAYMVQTDQPEPCGDTGDYCRARAKLDLTALQRLVRESAYLLELEADPSWLWKGLHAKLVDGFTMTMPDTSDNQRQFPQLKSQTPGVGFPIARACSVVSLATACVCDVAFGPYSGKETGETALLRSMLGSFEEDDLVVFDRYCCNYMMLAMLKDHGTHVCARLHQARSCDFRRGRRLGPDDHLVTWTRPPRPDWMSPEQYAEIPETLELREVRFHVHEPGCRVKTLTIVTTLTDPEEYTKEDLAELYGLRWNVETDILQIKQTLGLDHLRCKTPHMIQREFWVALLAYNLIRKLIATSAAVHEKQPRRLGFTLACQSVLSAWMLLSTGACSNVHGMYAMMLRHIAANEVANRPGRIEPRVIKRRRHRYPLMQRPRKELQEELGKP